jgi:hypothetical protein
MSQLGDRRAGVRLEVVGSLWATLELNEVARVVNTSATGALIVSRTALPLDSIQVIQLRVQNREMQVSGRVRHLQRAANAPDEAPEYLVGLEFVANTPVEPVT